MIKKRYLSVLLGTLSMHAQQTIVASGADMASQDGVVNYSIGQVLYTDINDTDNTVWAGVQQPFEVSEVLSVKEENIDHKLEIYPNPVVDVLYVNMGAENKKLSYTLYDALGRVVRKGAFSEQLSTLNMDDLPAAMYFLLLKNNSVSVKVFKLIKK